MICVIQAARPVFGLNRNRNTQAHDVAIQFAGAKDLVDFRPGKGFKVDKARAEDADAIMKVMRAGGEKQPILRASVYYELEEELLSKDERYLIVRLNGQVAGCCKVSRSGLDDSARLTNLCVLPGARGRGIARSLVTEAVRYAKEELKASQIVLDTCHPAVLRICRSLDFTENRSGLAVIMPDMKKMSLVL